jgi:hypothetical protein
MNDNNQNIRLEKRCMGSQGILLQLKLDRHGMFDRRAPLSLLIAGAIYVLGWMTQTDKRVCTLMQRNAGGMEELQRTLMDPANATVRNERCLPLSPEDGNKSSFRNVAFSRI